MTIENYLGGAFISFMFLMVYVGRIGNPDRRYAVFLALILGASIVLLAFGAPKMLTYPPIAVVVLVLLVSVVKRMQVMAAMAAIVFSMFLLAECDFASYAIVVNGLTVFPVQAGAVVCAVVIMRVVTKHRQESESDSGSQKE